MQVRTQKRRQERRRMHKKDLFEEKCEEMHLGKQNRRAIVGNNPGNTVLGLTLRRSVTK